MEINMANGELVCWSLRSTSMLHYSQGQVSPSQTLFPSLTEIFAAPIITENSLMSLKVAERVELLQWRPPH